MLKLNEINTKNIFFNFSSLFTEKVMRLIGNFAASIFIAITLGPEGYGQYVFVVSFVYIFYPLLDFGLTEIIIKDLTKLNFKAEDILGASIKFRVINSIVMATIASAICIYLLEIQTSLTIYILILSYSFILRSFDVIAFYYQAKLENRRIARLNNLIFIILLMVKIWGIYNKRNIGFFILTSALENVLYGFLYSLYALKEKVHFNLRNSAYSLKPHLKTGLITFIAFFLSSIHLRMDLLFVQHFLPEETLGVYSLANRFIQASLFIPEALAIIAFPILVKANSSQISIKKYFSISFAISFLTMISFIIICSINFPSFISKSYRESFEILQKISFLIPLVFFNVLCLRCFILKGNIMILVKINLFLLITNFLLNYIGVLNYGVEGIILATGFAYIFTFLTFITLSKDYKLFASSFFFPKFNYMLKKND